MPVVAVINRKGGSGKSTLATHIAAHWAHAGHAVMIGDVDRQQSTRAWLKLRPPSLPSIAPWALDQGHVLRVPKGITHVVLDTPGGIHGFELARVVMSCDAIVIPVCNSIFDRDSAAACFAELKAMPRISSGRCKVAAVGMRVDARTQAQAMLRDWAQHNGLDFLGVLRQTQRYVRTIEAGMTLFDLPVAQAAEDLAQLQTIVDWLPSVQSAAAMQRPSQAIASGAQPLPKSAVLPTPARTEQASGIGLGRHNSLMPAQESLAGGARLGGAVPRYLQAA